MKKKIFSLSLAIGFLKLNILFPCNAKSFSIFIPVFFFFFFFWSFSFSSLLLDELPKYFLQFFYHFLPRESTSKIGLISLVTLKEACMKIVS